MVTHFHTLLHFVTLFTTILSPFTCVAASTSIPGVSKSHLLSIFHCVHTHTQTFTAGPIHYSSTISGIDLVSIHIRGNHSRTICLLRVMITTRLRYSTVKRSPSRSQSLRIVYTVFIVITVTSLFMAVLAQ